MSIASNQSASVPAETAITPDPRPVILEGDDLTVRYGRRTVLQDVTVRLRRGEALTVIGPNGAGKTTLIRCLLGLIRPNSGRVARAPGLRVGMVPQRLTIDSVMPLPVRRLMTLTGPMPRSRVLQALERTGVAHLSNSLVTDLSGGEFQRVLLARALLNDPDLLVLDEPVQGVDFGGQMALYQLIADLRRELDCAVLMVSHDLHMVMSATERVVCLNGHICCAGSPETVSIHPEFTRLFGPSASLISPYRHHHHGFGDAVPMTSESADDAGCCRAG